MQKFIGFSQNVIEYNSQYLIDTNTLDIKEFSNVFVMPGRSTTGGLLTDISGGVFDSTGEFITDSGQPRFDGQSAILMKQAKLENISAKQEIDEAIFGGIILDHFGHFLLESTCRIWAKKNMPSLKWIFILSPRTIIKEYQYKYLEILGIMPEQIHIVLEPTRVKKIYIPDNSMNYYGWVNKNFISPFSEAVVDHKFDKGKYFLSRAHRDAALTIGEAELLGELKDHGWVEIRTETLSPTQQVALFRSDSLIMGVQGSALHNCLFSNPDQTFIHICRSNSQQAYVMLDKLANLNSYYIHGVEDHELPPFGSSGPFMINPERVLQLLKDEGIISPTKKSTISIYNRDDLNKKYSAWWYYQAYQESLYNQGARQDIIAGLSEDELLLRSSTLGSNIPAIRQSIISHKISKFGYEQSKDEILNAFNDFPGIPIFMYFLSCFELESGFIERAKTLANDTIKMAPSNVFFHNHYIAILMRLNEFDSAIEMCKSCVKANIADGMTNYLYSLVLSEMKDPASEEYARLAALMMPDDVSVQRHLLNVYLNKGSIQEMEFLFVNNVKLFESDAVSNYIMSCGYQKLKHTDKSCRFALKAVKIEPDNPTLKEHFKIVCNELVYEE